MLDQFWTPILTLLGVIVGGLLTGFLSLVNSYFQAVAVDEREKKKLILGKLEEIFDKIDELRIHYSNSFLTYHRYLLRSEKIPTAVPVPAQGTIFVKILALVSFYAPELEPKLNQILQADAEFSKFEKEVILFLSEDKTDSDEINQLTIRGKDPVDKIHASCLDMQREVANLSKKYL